MSTYAIGDIQGCYAPLTRLLARLELEPHDRLWLVGDLVNRGPASLDVLRWAMRNNATTVLGNHDLHLLAVAHGVRPLKSRDTLGEVLQAPDLNDIVDWLCHRPLLHYENGYLLMHAGLWPEWSVDEALTRARACEAVLRSSHRKDLLQSYYKASGMQWHDACDDMTRLGLTLQIMTRMRALAVTTFEIDHEFSGPPSECPEGYWPWFDLPQRQSQDVTIVCGHWAALGLHMTPNVMALDTGCVWGNQLTAVRLEDRAVFQVDGDMETRSGD